jgi:hypothetical protein
MSDAKIRRVCHVMAMDEGAQGVVFDDTGRCSGRRVLRHTLSQRLARERVLETLRCPSISLEQTCRVVRFVAQTSGPVRFVQGMKGIARRRVGELQTDDGTGQWTP